MTVKPPPPAPSRIQVPAAPVETPWYQVLMDVGYPLDVVVLDWETYFDDEYGLKALSIPEYLASNKFEEIGLARLHVDGRNPHIDPDALAHFEVGHEAVTSYLSYLQKTYGEDMAGCTVVAQNAPFDLMLAAMKYDLHPRFVIDTTSLARAYHTRSKHGLKDLCKKFSLKDKGDTKDFLGCTLRHGRYVVNKGRGKHRKPPEPRPLMTEEQIKAMAGYACNDAAREFELLTLLLPKLSNPAIELRLMDSTLRMVTQPVLRIDQEAGGALIAKMQAGMDTLVTEIGAPAEDITGNIAFDRLLTEAIEAAGDQPQQYMRCMKAGWVYGLAKDDVELKALQQHPSERVRKLVRTRSVLKSAPLHVARVHRIVDMATACGGLMPIPLTFHGAHTGRDSGSWNLNVQNLPKSGDGAEIKRLFLPPEGQELVVVDLAGIEARVIAYLANQADLLDAFRGGADIYSNFATIFFGKKVRKPLADDPKPLADIMSKRRQFGKICCLGLGYQMGKDRFSEFAGVDIDTAERAVKVYREAHPAIVNFWGQMGKGFTYTAKYRKPCGLPLGVSFHSTDDVAAVMTLPNGRRLNYHQVKIELDEYGRDRVSVYNEVTHSHDHLFGGMLAENVVQAVSRDVFMEATLRLQDLGHRTLMRIHDELVLSVPRGQGSEVLALAVQELSREPVWAPGLPLAAEGKVLERFGNH